MALETLTNGVADHRSGFPRNQATNSDDISVFYLDSPDAVAQLLLFGYSVTEPTLGFNDRFFLKNSTARCFRPECIKNRIKII